MSGKQKKKKVQIFDAVIYRDQITGKKFKQCVRNGELVVMELTQIETIISTAKATSDSIKESLNEQLNQNQN